MRLRALAPAKVNLSLLLGPVRDDGRHELVTVFESLSLADELELADGNSMHDEVVCPDVEGPNLVSSALDALRAAGWSAPPVRIEIVKRIPLAAGLGGGSADAAAALRLADAVQPVEADVARRLARELGADVPSQLEPGLSLGVGAGDVVADLPALPEHAFVLVPQSFGLATAAVYREADRLGLTRASLDGFAEQLSAGVRPELRINDLARAAISLAPPVASALDSVGRAGADEVIICGSGPTVAGIFWGAGSADRAAVAQLRLGRSAIVAQPVDARFAAPRSA